MPIRPENKARYPKDWPEISRRIRFDRAKGKCEKCGAQNYEPHPDTGSRVVLTVAHLGLPAHSPFLLHMARNADTDQIVNIVGLFVPFNPEILEWKYMMYARTLSEFRSSSPAFSAPFFITLQCEPAAFPPARTVIVNPTSVPVWVRLTSWRLLGEPEQAASIAAKSPSFSDVESTDIINFSTSLTNRLPQSSFRNTELFIATGRRTRSFVVRGLLRSQREHFSANATRPFSWGFPDSSHALLYHKGQFPENCADDNLMALCQRCHLRYDKHHHTACDKTMDMFKEEK